MVPCKGQGKLPSPKMEFQFPRKEISIIVEYLVIFLSSTLAGWKRHSGLWLPGLVYKFTLPF